MSILTVKIAGTAYPVRIGSFSIPDHIEQSSECKFTVKDANDAFTFYKGQEVIVTDSVEGVLFTGEIHTSNRDKQGTTGNYVEHAIECVDKHAIPESISSNRLYEQQYAAPILIDQIKPLAYRGIVANYAMDQDSTLAEWSAGTQSNTVPSGNVGDGNLELAPAGVAVNFEVNPANSIDNIFTHNGYDGGLYISCATMKAIQYTASCTIPGAGNSYLYISIKRSVAYTIVSGDQLTYEMWIPKSSKMVKASVDFVCTDGTTLRDNGTTFDGQYLSPHPNTDLKGYENQWYSRTFNINVTGLSGKTIDFISLGFEGDDTGDYAAYFRRIKIINGATTKVDVFNDASTSTPNIPQVINRGSYTNESVTIVDAYDASCFIESNSAAISRAGIYRSSLVTYSVDLPDGNECRITTPVDRVSGDTPAVYQLVTNNSSMPGLIAGMDLTNISTFFFIYLFNNSDLPTNTPKFRSLNLTINPSYSASKSDVRHKTKLTADYSGTLTNLTAASDLLYISGYQHKFDLSNPAATLYGNGTPAWQLFNRSIEMTVNLNAGNNTDAKLKLTDAGNWQNFIAEVDISFAAANITAGLFFRTTSYGNGNNNYAYIIYVKTTEIGFARGSNSSSGSDGTFTSITTTSLTLSANTWYTLKIEVSGTSFKAYINGVKEIDTTNNVYSASGGIGPHVFNGTGANGAKAYFKNFGVVAALSGTYVTPAIDIHTASTVLAAFVRAQAAGDTQGTIQAEISLNNGSSWTDCAGVQSATQDAMDYNYLAETVPGLAPATNVSSITQVKLRWTLSISAASVHLELQGFIFYVLSAYSSSGTRISPALLPGAIGRVGSTLAAYNAVQPAGTSVVMAISLNGTSYTNVSSGSPIPGINQQASPIIDNFDLLTAGSYTVGQFGSNIHGSGTWDTANSRLIWTGGNTGTLLYNTALSVADSWVLGDFDQADGSGLMTNRNTGAGTGYYFQAWDASAGSNQNTVKLFRRASGTSTQVGSTASISFVRGAKKRFILDVRAGVLAVKMDGEAIITYTDGSPLGAGQSGLVFGALARVCNLRIQALGDDLTGKQVQLRFTLASTDPLFTPQVIDSTLLATSPGIGIGALIDTADYRQTYRSDNIGDLASRSGYISSILADGSILFNERKAIDAPWCLTDKDVLVEGIKVEQSGDFYRNRQTLTGVIAADGSTTYVTRDNTGQFPGTISQEDYINQSGTTIPTPVVLNQASAAQTTSSDSGDLDVSLMASITVDINVTARSGTSPTLQFFIDRKGADGIYYPIWQSSNLTAIGQISTSIGAFCAINQSIGSFVRIRWFITGTSPSWTFSISILGMLDIEAAGIGIKEAIEDVSSKNLSIAAANKYADARLQEYGVFGRTVTFGARHSGLQAGMSLSVTIEKHKMNDAFTLVTAVERTADVSSSGNMRYWYSVTAVEGPALDTWRKALNQTIKGG